MNKIFVESIALVETSRRMNDFKFIKMIDERMHNKEHNWRQNVKFLE
jgi:hypothetical protein